MAEPSANDKLLNYAVRHRLGLLRLESGIVRDISALLDDAEKDLMKILRARLQKAASLKKQPNWTTRRVREMLGQVRTANAEAYTVLGKELKGKLAEAAVYEANFQAQTLKGVTFGKASIVRPTAAQLRAIVVDLPLVGNTLAEEVSKQARNQFQRISSQVALGLVEGETIQQMVKRAESVLPVARRHAEALVRTATTHTTNAARDYLYRENRSVLKGVQYVATLDDRTTFICASLDGQVFDLGEGPRPPQHWQCRSTTIPLTKSWKELGLERKNLTPVERSSMNGAVPAKMTFDDWLKVQPRSFQDSYLGKVRADMFRAAGKAASVSQFVNAATRRPLTLKELGALEGVEVATPPPAAVSHEVYLAQADEVIEKIEETIESLEEKRAALVAAKEAELKAVQAKLANSNVNEFQYRFSFVQDEAAITARLNENIRAIRAGAQAGTVEAEGAAWVEWQSIKKATKEAVDAPASKIADWKRPLAKARLKAMEEMEDLMKRGEFEDAFTKWHTADFEASASVRIAERKYAEAKALNEALGKDALRILGEQKNVNSALADDILAAIPSLDDGLTVQVSAAAEVPTAHALDALTLSSGSVTTAEATFVAESAGEALSFWSRFLPRSMKGTVGKIDLLIARASGAGGFYDKGTVYLRQLFKNGSLRSPRYHRAVAVHEVGHFIEDKVEWVSKVLTDWRLRRIGTEELGSLSEWGVGVKGWRDEFADSYTGRWYPKKAGLTSGGLEFTEVLSSGVEQLYRDPAKMLSEDRDFMRLILSILLRLQAG